jgi:hypothetical protein
MAKEIDRVRARSALETIRESPVILLVALLPVAAVFGVVWWLVGLPTAIVGLLIGAVVVVVGGKFLK